MRASEHTENKPWQTVLTWIFWAAHFVDNAQTQSVLHDIFIKTNHAYVKGIKSWVMALNMLLIGNQSKNSVSVKMCLTQSVLIHCCRVHTSINQKETEQGYIQKFSRADKSHGRSPAVTKICA